MFTPEQINLITENIYVAKCSNSSIMFTSEFKIKAVHQYYDDGYSPTMIFEEANFDLTLIGSSKPKESLRRWKKIYNELGDEGLLNERRGSSKSGGRPKTNFKSDKEQIKYLKAQVDYLSAKNDFLAKLRGLTKE